MSDELLIGTVKWFDNAKGFGFIAPDGADKDVFVHYSDILQDGFKTLHEGDRVEFIIYLAEKGPQAGQVRKVDGQTSSPYIDSQPDDSEQPSTSAS
jgi:CspA family cold shock protein